VRIECQGEDNYGKIVRRTQPKLKEKEGSARFKKTFDKDVGPDRCLVITAGGKSRTFGTAHLTLVGRLALYKGENSEKTCLKARRVNEDLGKRKKRIRL